MVNSQTIEQSHEANTERILEDRENLIEKIELKSLEKRDYCIVIMILKIHKKYNTQPEILVYQI